MAVHQRWRPRSQQCAIPARASTRTISIAFSTLFYTTKSGGVGMGLSICRSIIDVHGGRLWAAANEPHSSVFQFTLPRLENELMNSDCR